MASGLQSSEHDQQNSFAPKDTLDETSKNRDENQLARPSYTPSLFDDFEDDLREDECSGTVDSDILGGGFTNGNGVKRARPSVVPEPVEPPDSQPLVDPELIWQTVLDELAMQMPSGTFDTWVRDTNVLAYEDGEFIIGLSNAYARDWLENRLRRTIKRTLSSIMRRSVQIKFRIRTSPPTDTESVESTPLYRTPEPVGSGQEKAHAPLRDTNARVPQQVKREPRVRGNQINRALTFDTFVVGNHNRLAHAAAEAVAETPGESFNPLFIYGGVGLGKTHLLNAIGNRAQNLGANILYCTSEQFTNELISAIRKQDTESFRGKYRQVDVLLIDDIQFIGGKESTQEEFFHTFNHLYASGRQIVLSSDRPPKAIATLEERLRSRFEGGLQTDISKPDLETRVAILQSKANKVGMDASIPVLMLVAERVDSNIRELEGALNRIILQARLVNSPLSLPFVSSVLDNLAPQQSPCTPAAVVRIVAEHFHLGTEDLTGRKRTKEVAMARQVAMYLLREENELSLPAIGDQLGGRDHSTVRYGVEKMNTEIETDPALRREIVALRDKIYTTLG